MFEDGSKTPRIFGQPLGTDFPAAVVRGLRARMIGHPPEAMGRVTLVVNTTRMWRRIRALFSDGPAGILPRMLLVTDLDTLLSGAPPPPPRPALRRRLELAQLIGPAVENLPEFAPRASVFALADSLARLMDEMQGEGVAAEAIAALDVSDQSGHWSFAQQLIGIAHDYVTAIGTGQDAEARQRAIIETLVAEWKVRPPEAPILIAGSTGSRGTTSMLMRAVAELPQGAVILPGFDADLPEDIWSRMAEPLHYEDHPQFRFARLMHELRMTPGDIKPWDDDPPVDPGRNRVVSLALRPAPVTDAWLTEGRELPDLRESMNRVTLLEAPSQRSEALAISMRLRMAAEAGERAALITPDRMLSRQVAAALDQWDIVPDDSAGEPLHLAAPGRFLRHVAELFQNRLDTELLLTLLKHPLTQSGSAVPEHGLFTQMLELQLRRDRIPYPDRDRLNVFVAKASGERLQRDRLNAWIEWLCDSFLARGHSGSRDLSYWVSLHRTLAELIAGGGDGPGELWMKPAGKAAMGVFAELEHNAHHGGDMTAADYAQLVKLQMSQAEVRDRDKPHPDITIWGTLEARVQGADVVILGGLNEDIWPEPAAHDPWLNRSMRHDAGLLLPDRQTGLSAHDFQQAVAAPEVWISRALRSSDTETVASRWVNRLTNMIGGLMDRGGPEALDEMRARGRDWLLRVDALEDFTARTPASHAAPCPPVVARPRRLSVTEIKTLVRDPYAIYAKHCLRLRPLDPLVQEPDAPIRGVLIHDIMERFVSVVHGDPSQLRMDTLMRITDEVLDAKVPWPTARVLWRARMERIADWVVSTERERMELGTVRATEEAAHGSLVLPEIESEIIARADRIDLTDTGAAILYDYKSGNPPTPKEQAQFDKQLLIEAAMIEEGAFAELGPRTVSGAAYIGLGPSPKIVSAPIDEETPAQTLDALKVLLATYLRADQPYVSRRMPRRERDVGDYDHLARHGEWEDADDPAPEDLS